MSKNDENKISKKLGIHLKFLFLRNNNTMFISRKSKKKHILRVTWIKIFPSLTLFNTIAESTNEDLEKTNLEDLQTMRLELRGKSSTKSTIDFT